jgi:hypothetical protein
LYWNRSDITDFCFIFKVLLISNGNARYKTKEENVLKHFAYIYSSCQM